MYWYQTYSHHLKQDLTFASAVPNLPSEEDWSQRIAKLLTIRYQFYLSGYEISGFRKLRRLCEQCWILQDRSIQAAFESHGAPLQWLWGPRWACRHKSPRLRCLLELTPCWRGLRCEKEDVKAVWGVKFRFCRTCEYRMTSEWLIVKNNTLNGDFSPILLQRIIYARDVREANREQA